DDRDILEAIQKMLGCGKVYELNFGRYQGYQSKKWKPHVKYRVSNQKDIQEKIIPFFEKYPLFGKKLKSFNLFKQIVKGIAEGKHKDLHGLQELKELSNQLKAANKKGI
ncbi:MAG: LAGLIDADG family homing endonuclease, partial [Candidatus Kryptoniota bacterium]